jgi:hypothetical protein
MILRLGSEAGCGSMGSRGWDWMTEITGGRVRRGERRLGRWRRMNGDRMGRAQGDATAQSGPGVNAGLEEIDRNRRNLNTGEKVMIGRWRRVLANLQSRAQRNGSERGIRGARTWKSEMVVAGRDR